MDIGNVVSMYSDIYSNAANDRAAKLQDKLKQTSQIENAEDEKLMDVCKQFESYFLEQVFKEMYKTIPKNENFDNSTSQMMDYYQDQFIQNMASQSTEQNSLGLAQTLYEQMKRNMGVSAADIVASKEQ